MLICCAKGPSGRPHAGSSISFSVEVYLFKWGLTACYCIIFPHCRSPQPLGSCPSWSSLSRSPLGLEASPESTYSQSGRLTVSLLHAPSPCSCLLQNDDMNDFLTAPRFYSVNKHTFFIFFEMPNDKP